MGYKDELQALKENFIAAFKALKIKYSNKFRKPKKSELYIYVDSNMSIRYDIWKGCLADKFRYAQGNCFKTSEEAQEYLDNLKTKGELKLLAEELNKGRIIDWENVLQDKYLLSFDNNTEKLRQHPFVITECQSAIYCLDKNFLKVAKERIGEERLIKMIKSGV